MPTIRSGEEELTDIPNCPGYAATRNGSVVSLKTGAVLARDVRDTGYVSVKINKRGTGLARLIALTFVPNPERLPIVLHKNGDKSDCAADNLEWGSRSEVGAIKLAKESGFIEPGTKFMTNLDGELEVTEYRDSKSVLVRFTATGNEYEVQSINLRNGQIQDRVERARLSAEKELERIAKAAAYHSRMREFTDAKEAEKVAREAIEAAKRTLKRNRLVGQEFTDNLRMKFIVIAPAPASRSSWIVRYPESGNIYTFKEGWMVRGGCYDRHRKGVEEKIKEVESRKAAEWYEANREEVIARSSEYQRKHKDKTCTRNRNRHARRKGAEGSHTHEEVLALLLKQEYRCACCEETLTEDRHLDHIMPLARGGSNWISNLQWLCPFCNLSKSDRLPEEWDKYRATPEFAERRQARRNSRL